MAVLYFPKADCVFIHIPKTAGWSIREGFFGGDYEGPVQGIIPRKWQDKYKFSFVRNPFDRLVSAWKMFTTGMNNTTWTFPKDGDPGLSLCKFLEIVCNETIRIDGKRDRAEIKIRHHTIPQTHPYYCLEQADFVGRFENLEDDFAKVLRHLGLEGQLPHCNVTRRKGYHSYFDADTRKIAEEFYQEDLDKLGYIF